MNVKRVGKWANVHGPLSATFGLFDNDKGAGVATAKRGESGRLMGVVVEWPDGNRLFLTDLLLDAINKAAQE